jgi:DNA sulfur modification protein DndE
MTPIIELIENKFRLTKDIATKLSLLGGRTGLPHNELCRYAFALSLKEAMAPQLVKFHQFEKDIARHTLTGEFDLTMRALLQFRLQEWGVKVYSQVEFNAYFMHTIYRGVEMIYARVKNTEDLLQIN